MAAGVGLVLVAFLSVALMTGNVPFLSKGGGGGGPGNGGPIRTATPSNVVIVDPRSNVLGSILYVKAGNIWLQHGAKAQELTSGGHDSMASFSPDGQWVYFIRTASGIGRWPINGENRQFDLTTPSLMRVRSDGSAPPESILVGQLKSGTNTWSTFLRQPVVSPDGTRVVVVTDGPDPTTSDVVLKQLVLATGKLAPINVPENAPLGHQDPAWSPDGQSLLFVENARDGPNGAPVVMRYDFATGKSTAITGPGYTAPAWSPDGRYIAATRTTTFGTDVAVLDARLGKELLRITSDGRSFDPVWSPTGDAIAYLSISGGVTDLWVANLDVTGLPKIKSAPLALTVAAGLDPASRPGWWIAPDQLPTPPPTPTLAPSASPIGSGVSAAPSTTP